MLSAFEINKLNSQFEIPGVAKLIAGNGGLAKIQIAFPAASADIYLHGAQVTSWQPASAEEVIFLSGQSRWEEGKAIRGGIPVCFPWFRGKADDPKAPAHGFARTREWQLGSLEQENDTVIATLTTESDDASRKWWPYEFHAALRISVGAELKLELTVTNSGSLPFHFEEALHTYNRVGDVEAIRVVGLDKVAFLDNRDGNKEKHQQGDIVLSAQTDNAYTDTQSAVEIVDPMLKRRIRLEKSGSFTTVVWNPWSDGAAPLVDLGDDEWRQMACVEASNIIGSAVILAPGQQHTMTTKIRVIAA